MPEEGGRPRTVLVGITDFTIQGLEFDGQSHRRPTAVEISAINFSAIQFTHYYGLDEVRYEGVVQLALGQGTKWPYVWLHALRVRRWLLQKLFNARQMKLGDRLTILKDVAELTAQGEKCIGALDVLSHRHGDRWAGRPTWQTLQERLDKQLQLLADAGDLSTSDNHILCLTGQGVRTLDERQDASRKHGANWRMQFALGIVAVAALVFAAAQANLLKLPTVLDLQKVQADKDQAGSAASTSASQPLIAGPSAALRSSGLASSAA